jgi:hypothetical protein
VVSSLLDNILSDNVLFNNLQEQKGRDRKNSLCGDSNGLPASSWHLNRRAGTHTSTTHPLLSDMTLAGSADFSESQLLRPSSIRKGAYINPLLVLHCGQLENRFHPCLQYIRSTFNLKTPPRSKYLDELLRYRGFHGTSKSHPTSGRH